LGNQPLKVAAILLSRFAGAPGVGNMLVARAPEPDIAVLRRELVPRRLEERTFRELELSLHRLGNAAIDMTLPAPQVLPRADQLEAAADERLLRLGREAL